MRIFHLTNGKKIPTNTIKYYDSLVRLFIFGKIPCHVRLFHTVQLLESSEY